MVSGMQSALLFTALMGLEAGNGNSHCETALLEGSGKDQARSLFGDMGSLNRDLHYTKMA